MDRGKNCARTRTPALPRTPARGLRPTRPADGSAPLGTVAGLGRRTRGARGGLTDAHRPGAADTPNERMVTDDRRPALRSPAPRRATRNDPGRARIALRAPRRAERAPVRP